MLLPPSIGIWVDPVHPASGKYLCDKRLITTFEGSLKKKVCSSPEYWQWQQPPENPVLAQLQINPLPSL